MAKKTRRPRHVPPHRPREPHHYRGVGRLSPEEARERALGILERWRELERLPPEERELFIYRRLSRVYGAYKKWAHYWERRARELERAGMLEAVAEARARARYYEDLAGLLEAITAEIRDYGFDAYVVDRLIQSALSHEEPTFPELDRIPGRAGEYLRAMAEMVKQTMWARGRGLRDWGIIVCDPGTLEYIKRYYPNYRFRVYGYREEHDESIEYPGDTKRGKIRAIHTRVGYMRGDQLDYRYIVESATYRTGVEHVCVELIPEG